LVEKLRRTEAGGREGAARLGPALLTASAVDAVTGFRGEKRRYVPFPIATGIGRRDKT